jgi:hypothetical protein
MKIDFVTYGCVMFLSAGIGSALFPRRRRYRGILMISMYTFAIGLREREPWLTVLGTLAVFALLQYTGWLAKDLEA